MSENDKTSTEIYDIIYENIVLYLNCPECKNIPYLSFNLKNPNQINIKCDQCNKSSVVNLNNYLKDLSTENSFPLKKCENHKNFFDKYCCDCHIQYCSKCESSKIHDDHIIKRIRKIFDSKKVKEVKEKIEFLKYYFRHYIISFTDLYITKFPKSKHNYINNNLLKPYIHDMKNFFHFCDCIILNYDIEYPDYYQQINLNNLMDILKGKTTLKNINEPNLNGLFKYSKNNFISNNDEDNLILLYSLNDFNDKIIKSLLVNDKLIILLFKHCLKLYNYKNKTCISKLDIDLTENEINLSKINKDNIGLISSDKKNNISKLKIYSISSNKIIFEKDFDFYIQNIKNINNNSFGIIKKDSLEVYDLIRDSKSLKLQMINNIKIPNLNDFIYLSNENYLIALDFDNIIIYDKNYKIIEKVKQKSYKEFTNICETKNGHIILGGRTIGLLNINSWTYSILFDDNIPEEESSHLAYSSTYIQYSHFNLTSFDRLICKQKFRQMVISHYDDLGDGVAADLNNICIFDFNLGFGKMTKTLTDKNLKPENIYLNENDEIIVEKENCINIYDLE